MAEEETKTAPEEGKQTEKDATQDQVIPYARFDEVNKRAKQAEQDLSDMRSKIIEFEDRDKSEVDRERAARERAESQLGELMGKVTSLEKGAWVRSAAAELNFHDPEDAVMHLQGDLGKLEDAREAKRLVRKLAESREHLVRQEKKNERPSIGRVFTGQQYENGGQQQQPRQQVSAAQAAAQQEQQFAEGLKNQLSKFLPENSDNWYSVEDD